MVPSTYVNGSPQMYKREDVFVNKIVTRRHIPKSSGGSGGSGGGGGGGGSSHSHGGHHGGGRPEQISKRIVSFTNYCYEK